MNIALVLSGGRGERLESNVAKQYVRISGRMVITRSLALFMKSPYIDGVMIVSHREWRERILADLGAAGVGLEKQVAFARPGRNRQLSVLNGLEGILSQMNGIGDKRGSDHVVLIHDAARPCLTERQIKECFEALPGHDGVMPVLPMKDTVYVSQDGNKVTGLFERSSLYSGQAPELFYLKKYYEANRRLLPYEILKINGSTEPAVLAGMDIAMIPGDENNFKITTRGDMERFRELVQGRKKGQETK